MQRKVLEQLDMQEGETKDILFLVKEELNAVEAIEQGKLLDRAVITGTTEGLQ